jgi:uncharacterized protein YqhQ
VVVATIRALKMHGGVPKGALDKENVEALQKGLANLQAHVENIRKHSISHPRCGTGFLLVVVLLSIFVFALLGRPDWFWRISSRIFLVPVIAAMAYEFIKLTAQYYENTLIKILVAPSMALQRLTTRPPDDGMLEVAIVSFKRVQASEGEIAETQLESDNVIPVDENGIPLHPPVEEQQRVPEPAASTAQ